MKIKISVCKACASEFTFHFPTKNKFYCSSECRVLGNRANHIKRASTDPVQNWLWALPVRAKRKGLEFNLEREDLIVPEVCPVFHIPLKFYKGTGKTRQPDSPSVDRIDNTKGYVKGNVRIISNRANVLKSNATLEELEAIVRYMKQEQIGFKPVLLEEVLA